MKTKKPEDITIDDLRYLGNDSFIMWCLTSGAKVDNNEIEFDQHRYLIPIYMDQNKHIVWQKAAQLGATVYMLLRTLWWLEKNQGRKAGLYFPTNDGVQNLSKDRLAPLIDSCPSIKAISPESGKLNLRNVGKSSFYLYHLGGVASKDSVPMDFMCFDEVRLCNPKDIDQALHRMSHSPYKYKTFMSTCKSGDTRIWVRKRPTKGYKASTPPELKSFNELRTCWRDYQALTYSRNFSRSSSFTYRDITAFHENGVKDVVEAVFDDGYSVVTTPDHKYATTKRTKNGKLWTTWASLASGIEPLAATRIAETRELAAPFDLLTYYVFGAYAAEGCTVTGSSRTLDFAQLETTDNTIREKIVQWAELNGFPYKLHSKRVRVSLWSRPALFELFASFGTHEQNKKIPHEILRGSTQQLGALLSGLVDGDGRYLRDSDSFEVTTSSTRLVADLKAICLRLGKPAHVRKNNLGYYYVSYSPASYRLYGRTQERHVCKDLRHAKVTLKPADPRPVFDITVDQFHNYVLENGAVAHNCGLPETDINARWLQGSQHIWMSKCGCSDGCDLARTFPECVISDDPRRPDEVYLRCPKCGWEIKDPQNGRYVALNPSAEFNSYHVSQLVSKFRTTKEVWQEYLRTTNVEEFYNAALGIPYIDGANRGVTPSQLEACINPELQWMIKIPKKDRGPTVMGVDQGGMYNMAVIADLDDDKHKKRIRHVEIIEQHNPDYYKNGKQVSPFERLYEMMDEFNVKICVVDLMPNYNEALKFAQAFPGRVYLAHYQREGKEVVKWKDRTKVDESIRKAGPLLKFKYQASMGRFPSLSYALGEWAEGNVQIPPLDGIRQMARSEDKDHKNQLRPESPARRLFAHLPRLVKYWHEIDAQFGRGRWEWRYAGGDPHLAHAWNYCNVALERFRRKTSFVFV